MQREIPAHGGVLQMAPKQIYILTIKPISQSAIKVKGTEMNSNEKTNGLLYVQNNEQKTDMIYSNKRYSLNYRFLHLNFLTWDIYRHIQTHLTN